MMRIQNEQIAKELKKRVSLLMKSDIWLEIRDSRSEREKESRPCYSRPIAKSAMKQLATGWLI